MRRALRRTLLFASLTAIPLVSARDAAAQATCTAPTTTCAGTSGYYAAKDDLARVTAVADPILRELRTCLDAAGGKGVTPALVIRWGSETVAGSDERLPVSVKVDAPGYESLPCVAKASGKLAALQNPRETAIRCEYGCPKPPEPPPSQPPLVVGPPPTATPAQPQQPVQPPPPAYTGQPQAIPVLTPVGRPYSVKYEKVWYGWQGLISDAIAFSLTLGGGFSETGSVLGLGLITFGLGTPIIHMAHGQIGRGFGSLGMRIGLPLVASGIGAIAGLIAAPRGSDLGDAGDAAGTGAIVGALVGGGGCAIIDAFALGYKTEKVESGASDAPPPASSLRPILDVRRDRASLGFGGTF